MSTVMSYTNAKEEWIKKVERKCEEAARQHGSVRKIHMNDYTYQQKLPSDAWRPYQGSTYAGEMIVNGERVEIEIDNRLQDNQVILEF